MRIFLKFAALLLLLFVTVCAFSLFTSKADYNTWTIQAGATDSSGIAWAPFYWGGDSFGNKYVERAAMQIPVRIDGFPDTYSFQFDLGASLTEIYETNFQSIADKSPVLKNKIKRLKSPLQFWNGNLAVDNVAIHFGSITARNEHCYLHRNYGNPLSFQNDLNSTPLHLGTIGADMFQNKVLVIDYPAQRFAVCDTVPLSFKIKFADIELDEVGRVILPMDFKGKHYRVTFDNGSSMFPLITQATKIDQFAKGPDKDTLQISSWRQVHSVTGRMMTDSFELAGQHFSGVKIYANHQGYGIDKNTDAMAGNALFWHNTIIIDFKNKKFGVK